MATIKGTNIKDPIVPFDSQDLIATHYAEYGKGGWRTVGDLNERDSIKELRRENLMVCSVIDDSYDNSLNGKAYYILDINHENSTSTSLLDNNNWIPLEFGGDGWVFPVPTRSFYTGKAGQRSYDENYIYICIIDNVWKRVAFDFFEDGYDDTEGTFGILANGVVPVWDNIDNKWDYNLVIQDIETTSGTAGNLLITYTDNTQKILDIGGGDNWVNPPITSNSTGIEGQRAYDDNYFYVCVGADLWKRINLDLFLFTGSSTGGLVLPEGSIPIWDSNDSTFIYDLLVSNVEVTDINGTDFINVTYSDNSSTSFEIKTSLSTTQYLNELTDVTITAPTTNEILQYNGSVWINVPTVFTDHTTAGYLLESLFDNATTGINNTLNELQSLGKIYASLDTLTITSTGSILGQSSLYSGNSIGSTIIPSNTLKIGDTFSTKLRGYLNVSSVGVFSFEFSFGGVVIASISNVIISHPKTNTLIELDFEITVRSIGVSGKVIGQGMITLSLGNTSSPVLVQMVSVTEQTIDTTIDNNIDYLIDWDAGFNGDINITNSIIKKQ